jgi:hypothetical protein
MSAFSDVLNALFGDPNIARTGTYEPLGGDPFSVRLVPRRADAVAEFGGSRLWSETTQLDLRVAEVVGPRPGDRLSSTARPSSRTASRCGTASAWSGRSTSGRREEAAVKLDIQIDGDLDAVLEAEIVAAERAVTAGVARTGEALKAAWRAQVTGAGLGRRLANAIRANRYPRLGESISAASLVFSRAAELTDAPSTAGC